MWRKETNVEYHHQLRLTRLKIYLAGLQAKAPQKAHYQKLLQAY
jgi:hypothetical protein